MAVERCSVGFAGEPIFTSALSYVAAVQTADTSSEGGNWLPDENPKQHCQTATGSKDDGVGLAASIAGFATWRARLLAALVEKVTGFLQVGRSDLHLDAANSLGEGPIHRDDVLVGDHGLDADALQCRPDEMRFVGEVEGFDDK